MGNELSQKEIQLFIKHLTGTAAIECTESEVLNLMAEDSEEGRVLNATIAAMREAMTTGSLSLLDDMYEELRLKEREGFENPQELEINSEHQNAVLMVMRLIQKRQ